jgi:hypothetical protein
MMKDPIPKDLKKLTGEHHQAIWESAKKGELHGLSPEDRKTAEIMLAHEEFHNQFEIADLLSEHEYNPEREVNPFLHVTLHVITETQLENRDPIEVFQFYNAMRKKNASHDEAMHLIGIVFTPLMFDTIRGKKPFDLEEYRSRLNKMKALKPEKIFASIAKEEEPL